MSFDGDVSKLKFMKIKLILIIELFILEKNLRDIRKIVFKEILEKLLLTKYK